MPPEARELSVPRWAAVLLAQADLEPPAYSARQLRAVSVLRAGREPCIPALVDEAEER